MIIFTSDIDWAHDEVLEEIVEIFNRYNIQCTFFATHKSSVIKELEKEELFEIAIHPNFNPLLTGTSQLSDKEVLEELLSIYPNAKGVRSHSMTQNSRLLNLFTDLGLLYDSNQFLPYQKVELYPHWYGDLIRVPYNWEDDVHFEYGFDFSSLKISRRKVPLLVLDFHPIHVFLNTDTKERYEVAKKHYNNPKKLKEYRNKRNKGAKDLLIETLENSKKYTNRLDKFVESFKNINK